MNIYFRYESLSSKSNLSFVVEEIPIPVDIQNKYFYNANVTLNSDDIIIEIITLPSENNNVHENGDNFLDEENRHDWDVLIFTQQWPLTTCHQWQEINKNRICNLPKDDSLWTIHGIWPTKLGTLGPFFCDKNGKFNLNEIADIEDNLNEYWPTIEVESDIKLTNWLWEHEWLKHGTCAITLEQLNNENKYFKQALNWRQKYAISTMLDNESIHPNSNNTIFAMFSALYRSLGAIPSIHCYIDKMNNISFIEEIRICFNKNLTLIDCDGVKYDHPMDMNNYNNVIITNCPANTPIYYPGHLIPVH